MEAEPKPEPVAEPIIEEAAPSPEEMAAYLGESGAPLSEDDEAPASDQPIPRLKEAEARIPARTKALMDELFRAKLEKVQRVDPKKIR